MGCGARPLGSGTIVDLVGPDGTVPSKPTLGSHMSSRTSVQEDHALSQATGTPCRNIRRIFHPPFPAKRGVSLPFFFKKKVGADASREPY